MQEQDAKFLEYIIKELVDHPDDVKIERTVDEMGVLLTLDVNQEDMGKVIGRSGNTAKAVRTLLRVIGMKHNARVNLKVNEPEGRERPAPSSDTGGAPVVDSSAASTAAAVDEAMADLKAEQL